MTLKYSSLLISFLFVPLALFAQQEAELSRFGHDQLEVVGFTLEADKTINISGIGAGGDKEIRKIRNFQVDPFNLLAYAWIIDAKSREMVWRMTINNSEGDWWEKSNRKVKDSIKLKKGKYELYFSMVEPQGQLSYLTIGKMFDKLFNDDEWDEISRKWHIKVEPVEEIYKSRTVREFQRHLTDQAIVSITNVHDGSKIKRGFSLEKGLNVEIYAIGEGFNGQMFDYAWLVDANTGARVWKMTHNRTEHAGGAIKNRVVRKRIYLPEGDYLLNYKTDDNHSGEQWNANPPYDPPFWGVTIFPADESIDVSEIKSYQPTQKEAIIKMVEVRNNEFLEQGLNVDKRSKFNVYAIGEGDEDGMADYGWITDAETGDVIWKMRYRNTEHAGGARKNRLIDEVVELDRGKYIVYYKTDGSHAFKRWNSTMPDEPEMWGLTLFPIGKNVMAKAVNVSSLTSDNILAELTRVRDDEHLRKRFTLNERTRIRILALGEGDDDEMFDYGWIVNESNGRKVWRMRYRNTDHAGGAHKNRRVNTTITLEPGTYTVHYVTDDSHSYRKWNMTEPHQQHKWGITLYNLSK